VVVRDPPGRDRDPKTRSTVHKTGTKKGTLFIYPPQADLVQHVNGADAPLNAGGARLIHNVRRIRGWPCPIRQ